MIRPISSTPPDPGALGWLHLRDVSVSAASPALADAGTVAAEVADARVALLEARARQLAGIVGDAAGDPRRAERDEQPVPLDRLRARFAAGLRLDVTV